MRGVLSFVVLALWLVATHHCQLEDVPLLSFLKCAPSASTSSHCDGDSCQVVESGAYKIPGPRDQVLVAPLVAVMVPLVVLEDSSAAAGGPAAFEVVPPELPRSWQFISRTALPVRAPSFAS